MKVIATFDGEGHYALEGKDGRFAPGDGPLPAPTIVFLGSVAACAGIFAVNYLKARGLPFDGLRAVGEAGYAEDPRRIADIRVEVLLPSPVDERHMAPLRRAVDLCTIKNTLAHPPSVAAAVEVAAVKA